MTDFEQYDLPSGWVWTTIGEVADTTSGGTPSRKESKYYINGTIPWVKSGELKDNYINLVEEYITEDALENSSAKIFPANTPLVALYGATVGRTGILSIDASTNQAICAIFPRNNAFLPKYIMYWLQYNRDILIEMSSGGAQPNINQGIIRAFPLPLCPVPEQVRVVDAIEAQLSRIEAGVEAIRRAQQALRRYKASVLNAACIGRLLPQDEHDEPADILLQRILTERRTRWEAEQLQKYGTQGKTPPKGWQEKYSAPAAPNTHDLTELPHSWVWASVEQVGNVQLGRQRSPKNISKDHPTKYIRAANITEDGLSLIDVLEMEFKPHEQDIYRLEYGDLVLSEASGSPEQVGKPAMWRNEIDNCCFQNTVIRFRAVLISSKYYLLLFQNYYHNKVFAKTSAGVGINHLSAAKFIRLPVPFPPLAEQERIVTEVERRLSVITALEQTVSVTLMRAVRLRQGVLRQGFRGELEFQDPMDESAQLLLDEVQRNPHSSMLTKSPKQRGATLRSVDKPSIFDAVKAHGSVISAEELLSICGYDRSNPTDIDSFYKELRYEVSEARRVLVGVTNNESYIGLVQS